MVEYSLKYNKIVQSGSRELYSFIEDGQSNGNLDWETVESFGQEWTKFDNFSETELEKIGNDYFGLLEGTSIDNNSIAMDVGCGTGRWTRYLADKVGFIEAIDPSAAALVANEYLKDKKNVRISQAEVSNIPFQPNSFDLVFSLGVLHHIPDTEQALKDCVKYVKSGGYFLVYLYYSLDNRSLFFKLIFYISDIIRGIVNKLPQTLKQFVCDILAFSIYVPFVKLASFVKFLFPKKDWYKSIPLSYYHDKSMTIIRNDSLDRFGTPLEQRFSRKEIFNMMSNAGLTNITFSEKEPFWHAIGQKK